MIDEERRMLREFEKLARLSEIDQRRVPEALARRVALDTYEELMRRLRSPAESHIVIGT
jgi:hypothetical protein